MLTIRMTRMGSKKRPFFRVVVVEGKSARDGSFVESLGYYNPRKSPEVLTLDRERLAYWVSKGAKPSNTLRTLVVRNPVPAAPAVATTTGAAAEQPAAS
jgi:small subunit ribosomal protein S16